eukprot:115874-Prymnesium_polylepis.1
MAAEPARSCCPDITTPRARWLVAFVMTAGSLFGYDTGVVSGALVMLKDDIALTTSEQEFV